MEGVEDSREHGEEERGGGGRASDAGGRPARDGADRVDGDFDCDCFDDLDCEFVLDWSMKWELTGRAGRIYGVRSRSGSEAELTFSRRLAAEQCGSCAEAAENDPGLCTSVFSLLIDEADTLNSGSLVEVLDRSQRQL